MKVPPERSDTVPGRGPTPISWIKRFIGLYAIWLVMIGLAPWDLVIGVPAAGLLVAAALLIAVLASSR